MSISILIINALIQIARTKLNMSAMSPVVVDNSAVERQSVRITNQRDACLKAGGTMHSGKTNQLFAKLVKVQFSLNSAANSLFK